MSIDTLTETRFLIDNEEVERRFHQIINGMGSSARKGSDLLGMSNLYTGDQQPETD